MEAVQALPVPITSELGKGDPFQPLPDQAAKYNQYPAALATYDDVVADAKLFLETLEKLHSALGTKFMIPTVGGKELNLHKLFVEVTSRGGIQKAIQDRKWKEITSGFSFPSTATNASFVLRKYYLSLLNHYEQLYFFKSKGWNAPIHAPPASILTPVQVQISAEPLLSPRDAQTIGQKRRTISEPPKPRVNSSVLGVIDGKFEHGYLVSVHVGEDTLRGIVYHADENSATCAPYPVDGIKTPVHNGRRKRRKKLSKLDPTHPKPTRSGYNYFFAEQHGKLKLIHSGKDREISKMIGELWNKLTDDEKAIYQEIGARDKERYRREMVLYHERQKACHLISNAVPIQQIPAGINFPIASADQKMEEDNQRSSLDSESGDSSESDSDLKEFPEVEVGADSDNIMDVLNNGDL